LNLSFTRIAIAALLAGSLAGCSALPSQGPLADEVTKGATTSEGEARYAIIDLTERAQQILARYSDPTFFGRFGDHRGTPTQVVGIGDAVGVTVWEAAGSHSAAIPPQVVAQDGTITVPYANRIRVAGLTTHQIEQEIVRNLTGKAIEPQALVTVSNSISNSVTVTGEVTSGARVPLTGRGDKILDVVAMVGGVRAPVHQTFITLNRGNTTATVPMQALLNNPRENVYVRPGDVITLVQQPQWFSAFGATGRNFVIPFDAIGLTLAEALAKSGGLLDAGSDPEGVFLMRPEPVKIVRLLDPTYPIEPGQTSVNVIYKANMRDANSYFIARKFAVRHQDILYVAGAQANQIQKALSVLNTASSAAYNLSLTRTALCAGGGKC
jgi:polysaccharide export outer membrane protein